MDDDTTCQIYPNLSSFRGMGQRWPDIDVDAWLSTVLSPTECSCPACRREGVIEEARDTGTNEKQIKEKIAKFANVPMDCLEIDILERR